MSIDMTNEWRKDQKTSILQKTTESIRMLGLETVVVNGEEHSYWLFSTE